LTITSQSLGSKVGERDAKKERGEWRERSDQSYFGHKKTNLDVIGLSWKVEFSGCGFLFYSVNG